MTNLPMHTAKLDLHWIILITLDQIVFDLIVFYSGFCGSEGEMRMTIDRLTATLN